MSTPNMCLNDLHSFFRTLQKCLNLLPWNNQFSSRIIPAIQLPNRNNLCQRNTTMAMWLLVTSLTVDVDRMLTRSPQKLIISSVLLSFLFSLNCMGICYPDHYHYLFIYLFLLNEFLILSDPSNCLAVLSTPSLFHRSALSSIFLPLMANNIQN